MKSVNCPICYHELVIKPVTPCFVCGALESFDLAQRNEFAEYKIQDGRKLILCLICFLEDVCTDTSDTLDFLGTKRSEVSFQRDVKIESKEKDKYCETCHKRLSLLKLKQTQVETT